MAMQQDTHLTPQGKRRVLGPCSHVFVAYNTGSWRMMKPIVGDECIYCGTCAMYCPTASIDVDRAAKTITLDMDYCKGCGICENVCPKKTLKMIPEGSDN